MNIIEEIRNIAEDIDAYDRTLCNRLLDVANILASMNALVPVPDDGEEQWAHCAVDHAKSMCACLVDGKLYFAGSPDSIKISIPDGKISRIYGEQTITLVRLVPLGEAEL